MLVHKYSQPSWPPRVVILGANGFVARALAARLRLSGAKVLSIGSADIDLADAASSGQLGAALQAGDAVVMAAALTPDRGRDIATLIRNMKMAEAIVNAIKDKALRQFVYFSSDAVYGGPQSTFSEATPASPGDLYGLMHRGREMALQEATGRIGIPFCILRPSAIYGPGDTHNSYGPNRFIRTSIGEGKIQLFGSGEEIRDHVFIDDVVSLTVDAIGRCSAGILNLVSGEPVPFSKVAELVSRMIPTRPKIESLSRSGAVIHRTFDTGEMKKSFPYHVPTPLEDGLRKSVAEFPNA